MGGRALCGVLQDVVFRNVVFRHVMVSYVMFSNLQAVFGDTVFRCAGFRGAVFRDAMFRDTSLRDAVFRETWLCRPFDGSRFGRESGVRRGPGLLLTTKGGTLLFLLTRAPSLGSIRGAHAQLGQDFCV